MAEKEDKWKKFWEKAKKVLMWLPLAIGGVLAFLFFRKKDEIDIVNPNDFVNVDKDPDNTDNIPEDPGLDKIIDDMEESMKKKK